MRNKIIAQIYTIAILLFYTTIVLAQDLETPIITSIEVSADGHPIVSWKVDNPMLIDGFIIKRKIYDGQGVISGTFNNVAVIDNPNTTSYTDISTSYGTMAKPNERSEVYTVASYKADNLGQVYYSLMSEEASTIMMNARYDVCSGEYQFSYNNVDDVLYYTLNTYYGSESALMVSKDTVISFKFDDFEQIRRFSIRCDAVSGTATYSPIIEVTAPKIELPSKYAIDYVTVNSSGLELSLSVSESSSVDAVSLVRRNVATGEVSTLDIPEKVLNRYVYHDSTADTSMLYIYRIVLKDECNNEISRSDSAYNIVLSVDEGDGVSNNLSWNMLRYWQNNGGVYSVDIMRSEDAVEWNSVSEVSPMYAEYRESLSNIVADSELHSGQFYYRVLLYGRTDTVASNTVCMQRNAVMYVPNAINPESKRDDDKIFRPRADFLSNYKLTVYDKRGAIVFQTTDISEGWDGHDRSSKLCPRDTYVYHISFKSSNGTEIHRKGFVNLVY